MGVSIEPGKKFVNPIFYGANTSRRSITMHQSRSAETSDGRPITNDLTCQSDPLGKLKDWTKYVWCTQSKPGQDRLCWLCQKLAQKRPGRRCLKARETRALSLEKLT